MSFNGVVAPHFKGKKHIQSVVKVKFIYEEKFEYSK